MAGDAALRTSLLWLAAIIMFVGLWTQSLRKMTATYVCGIIGIAGAILPDWGFFNRHFCRWFFPVTAEERASDAQISALSRFACSPLRVAAYATIYGFAVYKWWMYILS